MLGTVEGNPRIEGGSTRICLAIEELSLGNEQREASGQVMIYTSGLTTYSCGDLLRITGELQSPPSEEESGYGAYLAKKGIGSIMFYPRIELVERSSLSALRERLSQSLSAALPEPQCSLGQALLLGIRTHIPESLMESFRLTGTAHLIVISGLHIAILGGITLVISAWLFGRYRPTYIILALAVVWFYVMLAGMHPSSVRAGIMMSLVFTALWLGRPSSILPSLGFAAAIMVGIDPSILWDVSFQLSFTAMVGLAIVTPHLRNIGESGAKFPTTLVNLTLDSIAVSLGAIIATLPLIVYYFGYTSLVGLPATLLILWMLPGAIITTLLVALLGLFSPFVAWVVGWLGWLLLSYIIMIVEGFATLPFTSVNLGSIEGYWVWCYYGVLAVLLYLISRRKAGVRESRLESQKSRGGSSRHKTKVFSRLPYKAILACLLVLSIGVWTANFVTAPEKQLEVSFIDVGQGDAILIQTPSGQQILIDGGPDPERICLALGEKLPFWDRSIDMIVLTHPEEDHLAGLVEVLRRYEVGQVLEPGTHNESSIYEEWLNLIEEKGITRTIAQAGQQIDLGDGIRIEILHPQEELMEGTGSDLNSNSVVLRLVWDKVSFLLTGDIGEEAERELLHQEGELESAVLKVAHHGSSTSTCEQFLRAVSPRVAVISVGENRFGHPSSEVIERLTEQVGNELYLTSERGTITLTTDGENLWVETEK